MIEPTNQDIFFREEIARVRAYLESLLKAQQAYEAIKPKNVAAQLPLTSEICKDLPAVEKNKYGVKDVALPASLVNQILDEMPPGKEFKNDEIFDALLQMANINYKLNKNASTILSCLLSRKAKDGILEKIGRGYFKKVNSTRILE